MRARLLILVRVGAMVASLVLLMGEFPDPVIPVTFGEAANAMAPQRPRRRSTRRRASRRRSRATTSRRPSFDKVLSANRELISPETDAPAAAAMIDEVTLRAHIRFLADDLLEGRGTGTRGGLLAARYIAAQFESFGLEPASPAGSFLQDVRLIGSRTDPATRLRLNPAGGTGGHLDLLHGSDFVGGSDLEQPEINLEGDLVFVGHGISSAEQRWDDYKGVDLRGKIAVILVNEPPATSAEPELFNGRALTYQGRWTYKFEEAARRGAAGVILIHTNQSAGYDWSVVRNSWTGERFNLPPDEQTPPLALKSWVTEEAARRLLTLAGQDLDQLYRAATSRDFQPTPLPLKLSLSLRSEVRSISSPNVVGILRGSDPDLRRQFVALTAHWDHLGSRPDQTGDNIYNGAVDNASGIAGMIAIAKALSSARVKPRRSVIFIATTAEEQGLLGAEYYLRHSLVPVTDTIANLNLDSLNVMGQTTDITPLGAERSTLGALIQEVAKENGLTVTPESNPEQGSFFRSDHFPFAKAGIPAVSLMPGQRFVGHSEAWVAEQRADYARRYHQPSDEYNPHWDLSGMVQQVRIASHVLLRVAGVEVTPQWLPGRAVGK